MRYLFKVGFFLLNLNTVFIMVLRHYYQSMFNTVWAIRPKKRLGHSFRVPRQLFIRTLPAGKSYLSKISMQISTRSDSEASSSLTMPTQPPKLSRINGPKFWSEKQIVTGTLSVMLCIFWQPKQLKERGSKETEIHSFTVLPPLLMRAPWNVFSTSGSAGLTSGSAGLTSGSAGLWDIYGIIRGWKKERAL
jgi:hypothetical protein